MLTVEPGANSIPVVMWKVDFPESQMLGKIPTEIKELRRHFFWCFQFREIIIV